MVILLMKDSKLGVRRIFHMILCLGNFKWNVKDHVKDYAKVFFWNNFFSKLFNFNNTIIDDGNDKHIFNTFCTNLYIIFLYLNLNWIWLNINSVEFEFNSIEIYIDLWNSIQFQCNSSCTQCHSIIFIQMET
jgi:hypothetical protein